MATLTDTQKRFIVIQLARFRTMEEIREAVKEEFDVEVSRQQVHYYNPSSRTAGKPADRWVELHEKAREAYIDSPEEVPIAVERWRLEQLLEVARKRMKAGDHQTAMKALKQAAKERGQAFTNIQDVQSKGEKMESVPNIFVYGGQEEAPQEEAQNDD